MAVMDCALPIIAMRLGFFVSHASSVKERIYFQILIVVFEQIIFLNIATLSPFFLHDLLHFLSKKNNMNDAM